MFFCFYSSCVLPALLSLVGMGLGRKTCPFLPLFLFLPLSRSGGGESIELLPEKKRFLLPPSLAFLFHSRRTQGSLTHATLISSIGPIRYFMKHTDMQTSYHQISMTIISGIIDVSDSLFCQCRCSCPPKSASFFP